jgi:hypothetical protein
MLITDPIEKTKSLNSYYESLYSCERNNARIQLKESGNQFTISINITRKRLSPMGKKNPSDQMALKFGGEAMIPHLARLLDITMNNNAIPGDWKKAIVFPIYKGGDRSVAGNYRPVRFTSMFCKQMEHVIA